MKIDQRARIIICLTGLLVTTRIVAQDSVMTLEQKDQIRTEFNERFTGADYGEVDWTWKDGYYYGLFEYEDEQMLVTFNDEAKWFSTTKKVSFSALPEDVKAVVLKNYERGNIRQIRQVETSKFETYYDIVFNDEDQDPVRFSPLGEMITSINFEPDLLPDEIE